MVKPFVPDNEQKRLDALRRFAILDTPPESAFDRITTLAARLFEMPAALISLVDEERLWFKSCQGVCRRIFPDEISREATFCSHVIRSGEVLVVEDARRDRRFAAIRAVTGEMGLRFYAGAPLAMSDGTILGSLCLVDFQPRSLTPQQCQSLQDLAAGVVSELELRHALAASANSESLYRQMFDDSPQPMWVYDNENYRFLAVNDTTVAHFGYTRDELLSMTLFDIRPAEDAEDLRQTLQTKQSGTRFVGLRRCLKKDGTLVWMEVASHSVAFEGCSARLAVAVDVSERKAAEDALKQSISVLKAQQEAALDGILVVDENRRILSYNQRLCEVWNTPPEIIESGDDDRHLAHALSQLENPTEFLQRVTHLYEHPLEHSRDEIEMRDGRTFDRYSGPIVSAEGNSHGRVWYFRDVTERCRTQKALRQSEQRLALHIQQTPLAVIELDPDMTVTSWNPAAERTFGYTYAEAVGQNIMGLIVPEEEQPHVEQLRVGILTQTGGTRSTNHNRTKSGEIILCDWYNTPLINETGQIIGAASLARDITEEAGVQERVRRSEAYKAAILETAMECIISVDQNGIVTEWNPASTRTFGYSQAEAVGNDIANLIIPPGMHAAHRQGMAHFLRLGKARC